jgi:hypothetical protein
VILVDEKSVVFCNNEDWSNSKTRIWFVAAAPGKSGCAYVGFDTPFGQGGMNERRLAYDWVAGFNDPLDRTSEMADPFLELSKGDHSYDMPKIEKQLGAGK